MQKPSVEECIVSELNDKTAAEIEKDLARYLDAVGADDITKSADGAELAILIEESAKNEKFNKDNLLKRIERLALISLYNKNPQNIVLYDENGDFSEKDKLSIDSYKPGTTFEKIFSDIMSKEAKIELQKALTGKSFKSEKDFFRNLAENVILKSIKNPKVLGSAYITDILTKENAECADITIDKYLNLKDKSNANEKIAGNSYTKASLEQEIKNLSDDPKGGGGTTGGGSKGGSSIPTPTEITSKPVTSIPDPKENEINFEDIAEDHWAFDEIYHLKKLGVISGVDGTHFAPDQNITREQFVKLFVEALGYDKVNKSLGFADTSDSAWYAPFLATALENRLITGISEKEFGIGKPITRQDICVIVMRALEGDEESTEASFEDYDEISDYAKNAVSYLSAFGVVNGFSDKTFRPKAYCTRAQAAKIICTVINFGGVQNEK